MFNNSIVGSSCQFSDGLQDPPPDNMGVKNLPVLFHVDYLRLTAWIERDTWEDVYDRTIGGALGDWVDLGHGGRFYQKTFQGHLGARLYTTPGIEGLDPRQITVELPGKACQYIGLFGLKRFFQQIYLNSYRISVPRIDLAFDNAPFEVMEFWEAVNSDHFRSYARRDSIRLLENPKMKRENGELGCATVYVGTRTSLRMLRVYNMHGPTRVELEVHDEKALQVAEHMFFCEEDDDELEAATCGRAMGNLRDFIDVQSDWWKEFVSGYERAYMKLTGATAKEIDVQEISSWVYRQVSSALSVLVDVYGEDYVRGLIVAGRYKRRKNSKYQIILGDKV